MWCPCLYRTEHFSRGRKKRGRGVPNKGGKNNKRTRESRSDFHNLRAIRANLLRPAIRNQNTIRRRKKTLRRSGTLSGFARAMQALHKILAQFLVISCFRYCGSETGRIRFRRVRFQTPSSVSFLALTEFRGASSVSSSRPIICVPKRTHRVFRRTHRVCCKTQ